MNYLTKYITAKNILQINKLPKTKPITSENPAKYPVALVTKLNIKRLQTILRIVGIQNGEKDKVIKDNNIFYFSLGFSNVTVLNPPPIGFAHSGVSIHAGL